MGNSRPTKGFGVFNIIIIFFDSSLMEHIIFPLMAWLYGMECLVIFRIGSTVTEALHVVISGRGLYICTPL